MPRSRRLTLVRGALLVMAVPVAFGCAQGDSTDGEAAHDTPPAAGTRPEDAELTALREKFSPFSDIAAAQAAGYSEAITSCWYHRTNGGQGVHYANTTLIDGQVTVMEPEIVMYEPQQDGRMALTAIEYIIPFDQWTNANPPTVLGQPMHRNEALSLWVLHAWLFKENPSGIYADWNPNVTCTHAAESEDRAGA